MGYRARRAYLQRKKHAEDKTAIGSLDKLLAKKQVQVSADDLKILHLIHSRGCIHIPSIQANIADLSEEAIKRHMDRLVSAGIVKAELTNARKRPEIIYFIGKRIPYNEMSHALYMSECLDRLLANPAITLHEYKHEHILKSEHAKERQGVQWSELQVPDGAITIQREEVVTPCFLEIDSQSYTGKRLQKKVAGLAAYIGNQSLYWICYSTRRLKTVTAATSGYHAIKPILFSEFYVL
jgi:hypothetical protein